MDTSISQMMGFTEHIMDWIATARTARPGKVVILTDDRIGEVEISSLNGVKTKNLQGVLITRELSDAVTNALSNPEVTGISTRSEAVGSYLENIGTLVRRDGEVVAYIWEGKRYEFF